MKKCVASSMIAGMLLLSSVPVFTVQAAADIRIVIDGQKSTDSEDAPIVSNKQVLLPLRTVITKLGVQDEQVVWNASEQSVTLTKDKMKIFIRVGSQEVSIEGETITLPSAPILSESGKTYVPVELLKLIGGRQLTWDASTQSVIITTSNKEKVTAVLKSFETGDPAAMEKWISPDTYIQHNLAFPSGRDVVVEAVKQLKGAGVTYDIKRLIEDGDYVAVHAEVNLFGSKKAVFDIFRFENGKIVEHWDNLQDLAAPNPSGHTMVDGAAEVTNLNETEANKALIQQFYKDVFIGGNLAALPAYFDGDNYIQHHPLVGDGVSTVMKFFQQFANQGNPSGTFTVHKVIGEGNFVLVVSESSVGETQSAIYDLFRLNNGKIAEHWDIMEAIAPKDQWKNTNGKF